MSENITIGQSIHRSFKLISQAGAEINSLSELIKQELTDSLPSTLKTMDDWSYDEQLDATGWAYNFIQNTLPLKSKGSKKQNPERYLNIQISLDGDSMAHPNAHNEEPLIHISFWECEPNTEDCYFSLLMATDDEVVLQDQVLFNWAPEAEKTTEQGWTYSLYLTSLNSLDDITQKIVKPVQGLLNTNSAVDAGLINIEGIVRYQQAQSDEGLLFMPAQ